MIASGEKLGRYRILSHLGTGGMGEVYLAEDSRLERKVALKILPVDLAKNAERMRRFVQEAKSASALNHPNIITIYEIGEVDSTHFLTTEYIEGETLRQLLSRETLNLKSALDIAIQVVSALDAAHRAGIVHRDVKPENVMIRPDGLVKLLDFGIAKLTEKSADTDSEAATALKVETSPGMIIGTANYMSPEQAKGKQIDARTDIFSFGVMLYEMIAGRPPFAGESAMDIISSILHKEPAPLNQEISRELQHIIEKCLRKDREERYQTARDLLIDLKDFKQDFEFQNKLERTAAPNKEETKTQAFKGTTQEAIQTTSSAEYLVTEIKRHKSASMAALAILLVAIAGLGTWLFSDRLSNPAQIESIAVLPFQNVSGDLSVEYLSDGIAESLINSLTQLQQLRVTARSTAFRYKGKDINPQALGRELNVRAVLMGRVRQTGDRLNIQVDLVDTTTGSQLWGEEYERQVTDILSIKQAIAREVTDRLRLRLSGEQQQQLARRDTTNPEAYQFYLRGRHFWNKRTADNIRRAIQEFQQAVERDSNYALGYVGLADSYVLLEDYAGVPASETLPRARAAADRALQIDDTLAEAHTSLAYIYQQQWQWAEAEKEFRRAISLNPNYATAHHWFSLYFRVKRQFDDSLKEISRAQELDPLSPIISYSVVSVYLLKKDINSALAQLQRLIELDSSFPPAYTNLGWAFLQQRRYEEAIAEFQKAVELSGRASRPLSSLGYGYAVTGRRSEALQILRELEERYAKREAVGQHLAGVYAGLGDRDQVFEWLERDFQQRSGLLPEITWWFNYDDLRSDPRYADLMRRMGLEP